MREYTKHVPVNMFMDSWFVEPLGALGVLVIPSMSEKVFSEKYPMISEQWPKLHCLPGFMKGLPQIWDSMRDDKVIEKDSYEGYHNLSLNHAIVFLKDGSTEMSLNCSIPWSEQDSLQVCNASFFFWKLYVPRQNVLYSLYRQDILRICGTTIRLEGEALIHSIWTKLRVIIRVMSNWWMLSQPWQLNAQI